MASSSADVLYVQEVMTYLMDYVSHSVLLARERAEARKNLSDKVSPFNIGQRTSLPMHTAHIRATFSQMQTPRIDDAMNSLKN